MIKALNTAGIPVCVPVRPIAKVRDRAHWTKSQVPVDFCGLQGYMAPNRTPHASASVSAPGGSFFAQRTGKAGFQ
jgi:hypothetical protein